MTGVKHEIQHNSGPPSHDLRDVQIVSLQERIAQLTAELFYAKDELRQMTDCRDDLNRLVAQLTADLAEKDFFEADSLRATFEERVERLSAPVSDEEWGKGCHLANRSHVNDIIANRSKPQKEEQR